jgi:hypothetical protein
MTFAGLIYFMLGMVKASSQNALKRFFPRAGKAYIRMSQQAFSAARQKINRTESPREALGELFQAGARGSYREGRKEWRGYRLLAVDGSFIQLPADPGLPEYYGGLGHGGKTAAALASMLYGLGNDLIVDAKRAPAGGNERAPAEEHLEALRGLGVLRRGENSLFLLAGIRRMSLLSHYRIKR